MNEQVQICQMMEAVIVSKSGKTGTNKKSAGRLWNSLLFFGSRESLYLSRFKTSPEREKVAFVYNLF